MRGRPARKKPSSSSKRAPKRASSPSARKTVKKAAKRRPSLRTFRKIKPTVPLLVETVKDEAAPAHWEDDRVPQYYGEDKMVLLVRDPWWLFAYWEVTPGRQKQLQYEMGAEASDCKTVLRVYDVTGGLSLPRSNSFFDIELNFYADNWYIDTGLPDREWLAEIGYRTASGRFFTLVRSNRVRTPSFGISEVLDEEWMLPEEIYYRLIGRSLGEAASGNSMDIRRLLEKYLKNVVSSENTPEMSKKAL